MPFREIPFWERNIATLFGLGNKTTFPGTLGSVAALVFSFLSYYFFNKGIYVGILLVSTALGLWAVSNIQKKKGYADYSAIIIDEWVGMWIVGLFLFEVHHSLLVQIAIALLGFTLFRIIDIFKFIPPIGAIDTQEKQTAALVMLDDVVGGFYSYAILMFVFGLYNMEYVYLSFLLLVVPMIANMMPVLLRGIKAWSKPVSQRLFGVNKTWRGYAGGTIFGTLFFYLLFSMNFFGKADNIISVLFVGFLFSFGALTGDLIKSYWKRKAGIPEGENLILWDQVDYVFGAIAATCFIYDYSLGRIVLMLIIGGFMSASAHRFAYLMKMINTKS